MPKGSEESLRMPVTVIILIVFVTIAYFAIRGQTPDIDIPEEEEEEDLFCKWDTDCETKKDGPLCLEKVGREHTFCGCLLDEDCEPTEEGKESGICGPDNTCR